MANLSSRSGERLIGRARGLFSSPREPAGELDGSEPNGGELEEVKSGSGTSGRLRLPGSPIERASRLLGAALGRGRSTADPRVRALRAILDGGGVVGPRGGDGRESRPRHARDLAVLGRAAAIALATLAGTTDSGAGTDTGSNGANGGGVGGIDRIDGEESDGETATLGRRLRESGPAVLVPLAWSFALAAHLGRLEARTVLIAHLVMDCILASFAAASWSEMSEGVLYAWKLVLLVGLGFTLLGTAALLGRSEDAESEGAISAGARSGSERALSLTVLAWLLVPAAGLAYTGLRVGENEGPRIHLAGAALSALGGLVYASASPDSPAAPRRLLGLALANVGQTAGIVNAVYQY